MIRGGNGIYNHLPRGAGMPIYGHKGTLSALRSPGSPKLFRDTPKKEYVIKYCEVIIYIYILQYIVIFYNMGAVLIYNVITEGVSRGGFDLHIFML